MKQNYMKNLLIMTLLLSVTTYANHPSFDCSKVEKKSTEGIICASDTLMDLDRELSALYKEATSKATKEDMLKATQRGWIKGRNDCWKADDEIQCIEDAYRSRMDELKGKYGSGEKKTPAEKVTFHKTLSLQGITFEVSTTGEGSLRQLTIKVKGLEGGTDVVNKEIDGAVVDAEVADLNRDGFPEIYVYISGAGSGSYGSLVAYGSNSNKSMTEIYLPHLEDDKKASKGYMGHDAFTIIENTLARRFPIYKKEDPNCCPTGGTRQLEYKLKAGEAGWILRLHKSTDLK